MEYFEQWPGDDDDDDESDRSALRDKGKKLRRNFTLVSSRRLF